MQKLLKQMKKKQTQGEKTAWKQTVLGESDDLIH